MQICAIFKKEEGEEMSDFQKVYEEYAKAVYRFLLSLSGNEEQAEELLQETFYRAFLHIDRFEGRCSIYTWLCTLGKNAWIKECKRVGRFSETPFEDMETESEEESAEDSIIKKEEYERVRRTVLKLSEPYKEVFILHAYGNVKLSEIAAKHNKSESWARVTYHRARQQIIKEAAK